MPHVVLEYTDNLLDNPNFKLAFIEIHEIINTVIGAPIEVCESQARMMQHAVIGGGLPKQAMVKLEIHLLEGRRDELKMELGEKVLDYLKRHYPISIAQLECQVIVRLIEIKKTDYFHFSS